MRIAPFLLAAVALTGCRAIEQSTSMFPNRSHDWRRVATESDQKRLRDWRTSFVSALAAARRAGHGAEIDREGAFLQPDATLTGATLPNGLYRCRIIKLGARSDSDPAFANYGNLTCRVSPRLGVQRLIVGGTAQRQMGLILPSDAVRQVFLGTLMLPGETRAMQYGADENRDVTGYVEGIGPARWRLVLPAPHFGSLTDVVDLVPISGGRQ